MLGNVFACLAELDYKVNIAFMSVCQKYAMSVAD